ncbi:MAG: serine/threonine-protein kinase [Verrucomicrobiota bacterium]
MSSADRLIEIFDEAKTHPAGAGREQFLARACAGDSELRALVLSLLNAFEGAGDFLKDTLVLPTDSVGEKSGDLIGRYRLRERLGEGGCGLVYVAEQIQPVRRRVAIKVIKLGMDTKAVVARFEAERQALAMMDHPHIARVLDAGTTEAGRPYFVMELVHGIRITDYCDQTNLTTQERVNLFVKVCHGVQHAHQKGIIHRDIKPSNILVTLHDGIPVPKVIDFGIAKAIEGRLGDATVYTHLHQFIGTPAYMSPEQAEMSGLDIDTRSDIYSLGVLLYELLVGSPPFDANELIAAGLEVMRKTIREREPVRPSSLLANLCENEQTTAAKRRGANAHGLIHLLSGDLDWIVMKCLEKDRTRRYETANDLAADLKRYLDNETVLARPPSPIYRCQKLLRRHGLAVGATGGVALALIAGTLVSTWQARQASKARQSAIFARQQESSARQAADRNQQRAERGELAVRRSLYASDMKLAMQAWDAGEINRARDLLLAHVPAPNQEDLRGFDWRLLWGLCRPDESIVLPFESSIWDGLALSANGKLVAMGGPNGRLQLWDLHQQRAVGQLRGHALQVCCLAFSPDGRVLASGSGGLFAPNQAGELKLWNLESRTLITNLFGHSLCINDVGFSYDARFLATAGADQTILWEMAQPK